MLPRSHVSVTGAGRGAYYAITRDCCNECDTGSFRVGFQKYFDIVCPRYFPWLKEVELRYGIGRYKVCTLNLYLKISVL
jgi:hypothetical protein